MPLINKTSVYPFGASIFHTHLVSLLNLLLSLLLSWLLSLLLSLLLTLLLSLLLSLFYSLIQYFLRVYSFGGLSLLFISPIILLPYATLFMRNVNTILRLSIYLSGCVPTPVEAPKSNWSPYQSQQVTLAKFCYKRYIVLVLY